MKSLTAFIIVIVSIALLAFYAWPQWQTVSSLQEKNAQLKDAENKAQELSRLRNNLLAQYQSIPQAEIERIGKVIPVQYDPIKLTADVNAIAMRHGMIIKDVSFMNQMEISNTGPGVVIDAPQATLYKVVVVSLLTEGQYKNFTLLLADLEKNLQILDIKNVEITAKSAQGKVGSPVLDFKITLDTYWMN